MHKLNELVRKFQDLSIKTGRYKSTSFGVTLEFDPHFNTNGKVNIVIGGYDIPGFGRTHIVESTADNWINDLEATVAKAQGLVENYKWCQECQEYMQHDTDGKCFECEEWK